MVTELIDSPDTNPLLPKAVDPVCGVVKVTPNGLVTLSAVMESALGVMVKVLVRKVMS